MSNKKIHQPPQSAGFEGIRPFPIDNQKILDNAQRPETGTDQVIGSGQVPMLGGTQNILSLKFGKTIHNSAGKDLKNSTICEVGRLLTMMPEEKAKKGKKKKKEAAADPVGETPGPDEGGEGGGAKKKKKKKKKEKPSDVPEWPPLMVGMPISAEEA